MPNDIRIFDFENAPIRIIQGDNGEPRWVAADVCRVLGIRNPANICKKLDDDEKGIQSVSTPGGTQDMLTITESGLYSFIMRSNKMEAKRFKKWVTSEVLPTIRKTSRFDPSHSRYSSNELDLIQADPRVAQTRKLLEIVEEQVIAQHRLARLEHQQHEIAVTLVSVEGKAQQALEVSQATNDTMFNRTGWVSAMGYASKLKLHIPTIHLAVIGKMATKLCKNRDIKIQKINDSRFGIVNIYPETVLESLETEFKKRSV